MFVGGEADFEEWLSYQDDDVRDVIRWSQAEVERLAVERDEARRLAEEYGHLVLRALPWEQDA